MRIRVVILSSAALALAAGCAAYRSSVWPDDSEMIEQSMRPDSNEAIPEGIALGQDAPPLAPEAPPVQGYPQGGYPAGLPYGYSGVPTPCPQCPPGTPSQPHIEPRPRGSIPGLLP